MKCQTFHCPNEATVHVGIHQLPEDSFTGWHVNVCDEHADDAARAALSWCVPTSKIGRAWRRYVDMLMAEISA